MLDVRRQARVLASDLLTESGAYKSGATFVDLDRLATLLNVEVQFPIDLGGATGGLASEEPGDDGASKLVLRVAESGYRSRFTLAHELGHAAVRRLLPRISLSCENEEVFVDTFASHVLLPGQLLRRLLDGIDVLTIDALAKLSQKAKVSLTALVSRISSAGDLLWNPCNFALVSMWGVSRARRENFAPRIVAVSGPRCFYLPSNRRLKECGLDCLDSRFDSTPLFLRNSVESSLRVYDRDRKIHRVLTLLFEYSCFCTSDGKRLMVVASEPVDMSN
jgi:hypothetical protein